MSRTPYSSSQDIQMEVFDNPGLQVSRSQSPAGWVGSLGKCQSGRNGDGHGTQRVRWNREGNGFDRGGKGEGADPHWAWQPPLVELSSVQN